MPIRLEDPKDPRLADYRELKDPARQARQAARSIFVVEGRLAVGQLLASRYEVASLLVDEHQASAAPSIVAGVEARGAPVYVGSRAVLEATVGFALHRGLVATASRPAPADAAAVVAAGFAAAHAARARAVFAVLEGLNDHENLGAIFRNAAAFGVAAVLLDPTCADPLYRRSVRVSLGHVLAVPFARIASWPAGLGEIFGTGKGTGAGASMGTGMGAGMDMDAGTGKGTGAGTGTGMGGGTGTGMGARTGRGAGTIVAALATEHGAAGARLAEPPLPLDAWAARRGEAPAVALLLGAEGPGLTRAALEAADEIVSIPIAAGVDSLNVATAGALAFYELSARWGRQGSSSAS